MGPFRLPTAALACALAAGCVTTGGGSATQPSVIAEVQAALAAACGVAVPATDIAKILAAGNGLVLTAAEIEAALCPHAHRTAAAHGLPPSGRVLISVGGRPVTVSYRRITP